MQRAESVVSGGQAGPCGFCFFGVQCFRGFCIGLLPLPVH